MEKQYPKRINLTTRVDISVYVTLLYGAKALAQSSSHSNDGWQVKWHKAIPFLVNYNSHGFDDNNEVDR